jgi:AmpE protein
MTFLAIIIAVLLLQAWGTAERVQFDGWFDGWQARVAGWKLTGGVGLAVLVALPALLVLLLLNLMEPVLFGLLWVPLAALLLLYAFGRGDFQAAMGRYRGHAYSGDFEAAYLAACEEFSWGDSADVPATPLDVHAMIQRAYLYEGLQRWFTVLFYFVLAGPAGAIAYRLLQMSRSSFEPGLAGRWLFVLDWLPARLLAATFTLAGDFIASRDSLLAGLRNTAEDAGVLLYTVGAAALGPDSALSPGEDAVIGPAAAAQNREFNALLSRSAACWIVVLSLLVLLL